MERSSARTITENLEIDEEFARRHTRGGGREQTTAGSTRGVDTLALPSLTYLLPLRAEGEYQIRQRTESRYTPLPVCEELTAGDLCASPAMLGPTWEVEWGGGTWRRKGEAVIHLHNTETLETRGAPERGSTMMT